MSYSSVFNPGSRFDKPEPVKVEQLSDDLILNRVLESVSREYYYSTGLEAANSNIYWCTVELDVDTDIDYLEPRGGIKFWFGEYTRHAVVTGDGIVFCGEHCVHRFALGAYRAGVRSSEEIEPATPESHPYLPPDQLRYHYRKSYFFHILSKTQGDT